MFKITSVSGAPPQTPLGELTTLPPDPLIVSGFAPKALAPRPLRRLKADPPSFLGTNLTLVLHPLAVGLIHDPLNLNSDGHGLFHTVRRLPSVASQMCLLVPSSGRVLPSQNVPILPCDQLSVSYCTLIRPMV